MKFKDYIQETELQEAQAYNAVASALFIQEYDVFGLNENELNEGLNDWLSKVGLKLHKGKGIINYVVQFGSLAGKMILAAFKGDKNKVKELASQVTKEDLLDFLYKLDLATMHIVTGPIHFIDAVTGWDLQVALKNAHQGAKDVLSKIWQAILTIKDHVTKIMSPEHQKTVLMNLQNIENSIPQP
jgi:hypothetical protein